MSDEADDIVVLTTTQLEYQAQLITAALEREGITVHPAGGFISGFKAEAPGEMKVFVKASDLERAREALERIREEDSEIDWSQVDVGDPD